MRFEATVGLRAGAGLLALMAALAVPENSVADPPGAGDHPPGPGTSSTRHADESAPHGGAWAEAGRLRAETVFLRHQTRIYLFDSHGRPVSAAHFRGEVTMHVAGNPNPFRYPLEPSSGGEGAQDHLVARVDVSRIRDGQMTVAVRIEQGEAGGTDPVQFRQPFALSKFRPEVSLAELTKADAPGIARQKVCPVMRIPLGEHGEPIKMLVDGQPLYLCCKGCVGRVQRNPAQFVPAPAAVPANPAGNRAAAVEVSEATRADQEAIRAQGVCPVLGERLGAHGDPLKVTVDGRSLFVCCRGCVGKVQRDPGTYFAKSSRSDRR